ncbi:MAG: methyltransferase domain-containing protein [candidate division Zixibacteria bacterium]|nr:methyltransferase domain-containing protein [candidate division Zixibacteria bacterium]
MPGRSDNRMEPYRFHVFVCDQKKPEGVPCCSARGSAKVIDALRREIMAAGLAEDVQVTTCGSIGLCERGPNMIVYPEGIWYSVVQVADIPEIVSEHFQSGRVVERLANRDQAALRAEIDGNKKKMLAARAANDAAGVLPDDFQQAVRGFQASRILLSAIELDVFTAVGDGASAETVASQLATDPRAMAMLLDALVALAVLHKDYGRYTNTPMSSRYLMAGARDDSRAALMHTAHLWERWSTLTDCVRQGTSVTHREMVDRGDEWTTAFIAAMHRSASARAPLLVHAIDLNGVRRVLDVGGGSGAYAIAFAQANNDLRAEVFDLPTVVPITQRHIDEADVADRVTTRTGDLRTDDFGDGYDLVLLSAICHMMGPEENVDLLRRCFAALSPGGRIVIQDFILAPDRTAPRTAALFAINMLVATQQGNSYTSEEYDTWLREAGCDDVKHITLPGPTGLMIGRRE